MNALATLRSAIWAIAAASLIAGSDATSEPLRIKLGTLAPKGSVYHRVLQEMGQAWRLAEGGDARFTVYTDGSQGGEEDVVRRMQLGQLNAAMLTAVGLSRIDRSVRALQYMPKVFRNWQEFDHVARVVRPELERGLMKRGFVTLFWAEAGWVQLFSNTPARTPDEVRRLKVFVWSGDNEQVTLMKSLGFRPVALETNDILPAMHTGLIDAAPVTALYGLVTQLDGPAPHMLRLNWVPIVGAVVVTKQVWDDMRHESRKALRRNALLAETELREQRASMQATAIEAMRARGLAVHELDPATEDAWGQLTESIYTSIRGKHVPAELFDLVLHHLSAYRTERGDR